MPSLVSSIIRLIEAQDAAAPLEKDAGQPAQPVNPDVLPPAEAAVETAKGWVN